MKEEYLISPGVFRVEYKVGTKVWFFLKGAMVEGKVIGYFANITPDKTLNALGTFEGGEAADVSNVGYCTEYYIPREDEEPLRQVQLLDSQETFPSLAELLKWYKTKCVLKYPYREKKEK